MSEGKTYEDYEAVEGERVILLEKLSDIDRQIFNAHGAMYESEGLLTILEDCMEGEKPGSLLYGVRRQVEAARICIEDKRVLLTFLSAQACKVKAKLKKLGGVAC